MVFRATILMAGCCVLIAACDRTSSNFETGTLTVDSYVATSAEQRLFTRTNINGQEVICAEPSLDVARAASDAFSLALQAQLASGKSFSGSATRSFVESIAQLGERLATIQLLRDELSDLCRSYANRAISPITYTLRLSQLDRKMVTLLSQEMAVGAFGRTLAMISGSASGDTGTEVDEERLAAARQDATDAQAALDAALTELAVADNDAKKEAARLKVRAAEDGLDQARQIELALYRMAAGTSASGFAGSQIGGLQSVAKAADAADTVSEIQARFLLDDDLSTILDACLTTLDQERVAFDALDGGLEAYATILRDDALAYNDEIDDLKDLIKLYKEQIADAEARGAAPDETANYGPEKSSIPMTLDDARKEVEELKKDLEQTIDDRRVNLGQLDGLKKQSRMVLNLLSPLGAWCREGNLDTVLDAVTERHITLAEIAAKEAVSDPAVVLMQACGSYMNGTEVRADVAAYCKAQLEASTP